MAAIDLLKNMVTLALIDGELSEKERQYIINIGQANHLLAAEILPLFSRNHPMVIPENLSNEKKFDYIFQLVQLMKIDDRLYREEIKYCSQVASRLGYKQDVMFELMLKVRGVKMEKGEMEELKKLIGKYLKGN